MARNVWSAVGGTVLLFGNILAVSGCASKPPGASDNLLFQAMALPKLQGDSAYERALNAVMRRIERTEQYRLVLTQAAAVGNGASSCAVLLQANLGVDNYEWENKSFSKEIDSLPDGRVCVAIIVLFDSRRGPGYLTNFADAVMAQWFGGDIDGQPLLDGVVSGLLSPSDNYLLHRRTFEERTARARVIRADLRKTCHPSDEGTEVASRTWQGDGPSNFQMSALADESGIGKTVSLDREAGVTEKAVADLWLRMWKAIQFEAPGDKPTDEGE